jgi:hypothetical protein
MRLLLSALHHELSFNKERGTRRPHEMKQTNEVTMAERARAGRMVAFIERMKACDYRVGPKPDAPSKHARKYAKYAASELGRARSARYETSAAGQERRDRYNHARYFRRVRARLASYPARKAALEAELAKSFAELAALGYDEARSASEAREVLQQIVAAAAKHGVRS